MTPSLTVERLSKRFAQGKTSIAALADVSLVVPPGQFLAIMGASGSGKSTLLNLVAGIARPDDGRILIDDVDVAVLRDPELTRFRRRKIGLVFQAFNLIPALTALDNVKLPVLAGSEQGPLSAEALLERMGLKDRMHHRPDALSGGEQQRVAIARSLIADPAIILADEPTGSLDSITAHEICLSLREVCRERGRTVIVVTHEPDVAHWADRVVVLRDGRILTDFMMRDFADARQLADHYHNAVQTTPGDAPLGESRHGIERHRA